ncbi:MAG: hypothetical protein Kow0099_39410 [Candidatus Abyssubacteria bacterium]
MKRGLTITAAVFALLLCTSVATATPTRLIVRVKSKGAKFVGTSMGGALVTITHLQTGAVLAQGLTEGATGNTQLIMKTPQVPGETIISDEQSARYEAVIDIDEPVFVEISARGPMAQRQSLAEVSITQWLFPGKHIVQGDALLLELPGFAVDILSPPTHVTLGVAPQAVTINANIVMVCGCPIMPGGLWDSDRYEIKAIVKRDGKLADTLDMEYANAPSQFRATYRATESGIYEVTVYAFDPLNGNTGLDSTTFMVR